MRQDRFFKTIERVTARYNTAQRKAEIQPFFFVAKNKKIIEKIKPWAELICITIRKGKSKKHKGEKIMNNILNLNPDYRFFIFLLTGSKEETERVLELTGPCESEDELLMKLKKIGVLTVGLTPDEYRATAPNIEAQDIPPDREKLISRLIKEYFESVRVAWEAS